MPTCYVASDAVRAPNGIYRFLLELGDGGQVNAYLATDPTGDKVCLKALILPNPAFAQDQLKYACMLDAAARTPGWEHSRQHVIAPHTYFVDGDHFLVEKYASGNTLTHHLSPNNRLLYSDARHVMKAIAVALMLLELAGLAHRDVNPNNIAFFNNPAEAALIDLGLTSPLLRTPRLPGFTPGYAPPEQYANSPANIASDVYSFGATVFHMLTGFPPFPITQSTVFHGYRWSAALAKALHDADVPKHVVALVGSMLAYEPTDRPTPRDVFKTLI